MLLLSGLFAAAVALLSHKYVGLYLSQKPTPGATAGNPRQNVLGSNDPEALLAEANHLAWLFNWPEGEPLYARAEELFKEKGDKRDEIYARVGRIRAQSCGATWQPSPPIPLRSSCPEQPWPTLGYFRQSL